MWNKQLICVSAVLIILLSVSCAFTKKTAQKIPAAHITSTGKNELLSLLKNIQDNENVFEFYQCKSKLIYSNGEQQQELDAIITMERNRYVYFSISAILGVNVARVLATPDSVVLLDLLHRKAIITGYDYLQGITQIPLTFKQLQSLIAGNALYNHDTIGSIADTAMLRITITQPLAENRAQAVAYDSKSLKPVQTRIWERNGGKEIVIDYSNPVLHKLSAFPTKWNIRIHAEKTIQCEIETDELVFEKKKELTFSIPKTFEVVRH